MALENSLSVNNTTKAIQIDPCPFNYKVHKVTLVSTNL